MVAEVRHTKNKGIEHPGSSFLAFLASWINVDGRGYSSRFGAVFVDDANNAKFSLVLLGLVFSGEGNISVFSEPLVKR